MVTYVVENEKREVLVYAWTLRYAKKSVEFFASARSILAVEGPYRYEGRHKYRLVFENGKWKKGKV